MRGINRISISGRVVGKIVFDSTPNRDPAGSFFLRSERHKEGKIIAVRVKVNVYGDTLVSQCRVKIVSDAYVIVDGELMNRNGRLEELVEVRAHTVVVPTEEGQQDAAGAG
jgi:hypothetical protein